MHWHRSRRRLCGQGAHGALQVNGARAYRKNRPLTEELAGIMARTGASGFITDPVYMESVISGNLFRTKPSCGNRAAFCVWKRAEETAVLYVCGYMKLKNFQLSK